VTATSLLLVFVLAKIAALWGRPIAWSPLTIVVYFWQDVLVALAFAAVEGAWRVRKQRVATIRPERSRRLDARLVIYGVLASYVALNVPVIRVLSTPMTWPMLRATSATLADSILLYATHVNAVVVLGLLGIAALLPTIVPTPRGTMRALAGAGALLVVMVGSAATGRLDTRGLHRNALSALAASLLPRVDALAAREDWTAAIATSDGDWNSSHGAGSLSHWRGIAAGRNVVLISLESAAAQYLRLYGAAEDVTPQLDALARSGVVFDNAYAVYPESVKGLFSVLCSTYPAFDTAPETYAGAPCRSIAGLLSNAGYRAALFHSGRFGYLGMEAVIRNRGYHTLEDAGDIGGHHQSSFGVDEPATVDRVLSWVDALPAGQRFFVTYLPIAGHHPYETPERGPFPGHDEMGRYRNALHYSDRSVGALVAGLRARGLEDDTVWIVLGDHGEAMGQHHGNYGHTFFLYEENVRVPFVIAAPGAIARAERSRTVVSLVDTAPTILDILGMPIPPEHQGRSALDGSPRLALFFTDYSLGLLGLRDGRWKFVHELDSTRSTLFDLDRDRGESLDLSRDHASLVAAYERRLRDWSAAQKSYVNCRSDRSHCPG
jgi:hypothetical protein